LDLLLPTWEQQLESAVLPLELVALAQVYSALLEAL
jgi:hypothetical protein